MKNLKPIYLQEAVDFVKSRSEEIVKLLTRTHHIMIKNFLDFKTRSEKMQYERDILLENWRTTEAALCMKSPVCEVEFAHDDRTALSLYDCLVPKLREQRRLNLGKDYQLTVSDIRV